MKVLSISIEKLFGQFDYDLTLTNAEGITLLTGPNGYGKTTILNIIYNLLNRNFDYIKSVPFKKIRFNVDNAQTIRVTKECENPVMIAANSIKVYFIKGQRLVQEIVPTANRTLKYDGTIKANRLPVSVKTITIFSTELVTLISHRTRSIQWLKR
ncbi:MAG: AAA family ATPase [Treponema sp.]|nr:AAA family ATPase [Treponema sp.]